MPNQSGKIVLIFVLILLILGAAFYFILPNFKKQNYQEPVPISSPQNFDEASKSSALAKPYYSKALKITFKIPENAKVNEKNSYLLVVFPNGGISMTFNGTNFRNAKEYFSDLKQKNRITPLSYSEGKINGYDYVMISDESSDNSSKREKTYFIYANSRIFAFSTSDEALYPVLDQIVQSFQYKP